MRHERLASGYGQLAAALESSLTRVGHDVRFEPFDAMDACLFVCPPSSIRGRPDVMTAAFTMHERETLPPEKADWPDALNTMDLVLTPTSWNRRVWQNLGVSVPVEVVPLGVDDATFAPPTGRTCTFLTVHENLGGGSSRENWRDTVLAYYSAFSSSDRVELIVKTWKWKQDGWDAARREIVAEVGKDESDLPLLTIVDGELAPSELRSLYQRAWLFVKNANREGWCLPCTEAVACGATVAATEIQPLLSNLPPDTRWFQLGDAVELRYLLKSEYRRFVAEEARSRRYTWDRTAAFAARAIEDRLGRVAA